MSEKEIKSLLLSDLMEKKRFNAFQDTFCENCGGSIYEGDEFVFMDGRKICTNCVDQIIEFLEV